jgi:hypothetical protein
LGCFDANTAAQSVEKRKRTILGIGPNTNPQIE